MSGYTPRHSRSRTEPAENDLLAAPPLSEVGLVTQSERGQSEQTAAFGFEPPPVVLVGEEISGSAGDPTHIKNRRRRWPVMIALLLVLILAGGVITYFVLSSQAHERETNRARGYALLDEAIALIQESDQVVVSFDEAIAEEVTAENLSERGILLDRTPTTLNTLDVAEEKALAAMGYFISDDDRTLAQHVIDAADNRRDMLSSGAEIISKDIEAMKSVQLFGQCLEIILGADTELRATNALSASGGYSELQEAITRNNAVLTNLARASELLTQAQDAFAEVDYSTVVTYVSLKTESVQLAIQADQAILDGDLEAVNTSNAVFKEKDAAVVDAASKIPSDPFSLITGAYDASTAEARALYSSARANAATADGFIREYTGVETQTEVQ